MQETGILVLLRITIFIALFAAFTNCTELSEYDRTQIKEALDDSLLSTTQSTGVYTEFLEDGYLKIVLRADESETLSESGLSETKFKGNVSVVIHDSTGNVTTTAFSNRAKYVTESSSTFFEFFGDVTVYTKGDRRLSSEYLKWNRNKDRISTPEFIIIVTPTDSLSGRGFEGNTDLSEYTITGGGDDVGGRVIIDN